MKATEAVDKVRAFLVARRGESADVLVSHYATTAKIAEAIKLPASAVRAAVSALAEAGEIVSGRNYRGHPEHRYRNVTDQRAATGARDAEWCAPLLADLLGYGGGEDDDLEVWADGSAPAVTITTAALLRLLEDGDGALRRKARLLLVAKPVLCRSTGCDEWARSIVAINGLDVPLCSRHQDRDQTAAEVGPRGRRWPERPILLADVLSDAARPGGAA